MKISLMRLITVCAYVISLTIVCEISTVIAQRTFVDKFINEYRSFRGGLFNFVGRSDNEAAYLWNLKRQVNKTKQNDREKKRLTFDEMQ